MYEIFTQNLGEDFDLISLNKVSEKCDLTFLR